MRMFWKIIALFFLFSIQVYGLNEKEILALQAMKDAWGSSIPSNWTEPALGCSWVGVVCSDEGHMTELNLNGFNLSGVVPEELGGLAFLESLNVSASAIHCIAPSSAYCMPPSNALRGEIPASLGNLSRLVYLDLACNQLNGSIPPGLGNLMSLKYLYLFSNQLSGSIPPELGNLSNLQTLYIILNQLSGSFPPELGNLTNLFVMRLYSNLLSGSIPPELGKLTNLKNLDFSSNQLSGSIPLELGNLMNLQNLDLSSNQLSGSIPLELRKLTNLSDLVLSSNQLSGSIPLELGKAMNMQNIDLSSNQLSGSIPLELGKAMNLQNLDLSSNQLSGSIPLELGNLMNLLNLDLSSNQLSGSIPPELGKLSSLLDLDLSSNHLSGSIPPELGKLMYLSWLDLSSNHFLGSIPPELGNLMNLLDLYLSFNQLSGSIPPELGKLSLYNLDLSSNNISGPIPSSWLELAHLQTLYLNSTRLSGVVPLFPSLSSLLFLDISNTDLSFESSSISDLLPLLPSVSRINVSGTPTHDLTPFCRMPNLRSLAASSCRVRELPECLTSSGMADLDVSGNPLDMILGLPFFLSSLNLHSCGLKNFTSERLCSLVGKTDFSFVLTRTYNSYSLLDLSDNDIGKESPFVVECADGNDYALLNTLSSRAWNLANTNLHLFNSSFAPSTSVLDLMGNPPFVEHKNGTRTYLLGGAIHAKKVNMSRIFTEDTATKTACPIWQIPGNDRSTVYVAWDATNYANCTCISGYFGSVHVPDGRGCKNCGNYSDVSAVCNPDGSLMFKDGFFPSVLPEPMIERNITSLLGDTTYLHPDALRCPINGSCLFEAKQCVYASNTGFLECGGKSAEAADICAEGYHGRLCTRCRPDFFVSEERECEECPTKYPFVRTDGFLALLLAASIVAVLLFIVLRGFGVAALLVEVVILALFVVVKMAEGWLLSVMLLLLVVYASKSSAEAAGGGGVAGGAEGLLKSLLFYLQTLAALSPEGMFHELFGTFHPFHALSFANLQPFGLECFKSLSFLADPDARMAFDLLLPLVCVLVTGFVVVSSELLARVPFMTRAIAWYEAKRVALLALLSPRRLLHRVNEEFHSGLELDGLMNLPEDELDHSDEKRVPIPHEVKRCLGMEILAGTVHASLFVLYAVYFEIANIVLSVFHLPDHEFMGPPYEYLLTPYSPYGWDHEPQARRLLIFGIIGLIGLVIFVPLLYLSLMLFFWWRHFRRGEFHAPAAWIGFLYEGFRRQVWWYELVWMARRLLLAAFLSVVPQNDIWQVTLILLLLMCSLLLHSYAKPFESRWENTVERMSLMALIFTYAMGQALEPGALLGNAPERGQNWKNPRYGGFIVLFVINTMVLVGYALAFASNYLEALGSFALRKVFGVEVQAVVEKFSINREQQLEMEVRKLRAENEALRKRSAFILDD